jgi:uncharacterized hydrophobic protein (TIGR00271 family)
MKRTISHITHFLLDRFNLQDDRADEKEIVIAINREVHFKGPNLWTLVFAIFIASIGLNVNSTAVIIGAMLISPIMGPIMGIGLGIGTNDFDLLKKGIKNLGIAAGISIITSWLYFLISPLHDTNSELLARTNPSIWDVFIAFFGGMAGIVAGTRREKSNVIPGVAIATALMPPLCTAGFSLATGHLLYFLGALYLFFINSFFICLATFIIVKHLRFHKKEFESTDRERKIVRYIWLIAIVIMTPSIYIAYRIVQRSIFESNAKLFVAKEFELPRTQVITKNYFMSGAKKSIELLLFGQDISTNAIDSIRKRLPQYGLRNTTLVVHQGLDARQRIDLAEIKASILEDVFKQEKKSDTISAIKTQPDTSAPDLRSELKILYPDMKSYSLSHTNAYALDSPRVDTVYLFTASFNKRMSGKVEQTLQSWLKQRLRADSLLMYTSP